MRTQIIIFASIFWGAASAGQPVTQSFLSKTKPLEQLVNELDLASFRNSLGPRRDPQHRTLSSFGLKYKIIDANTAVVENAEWTYTLRIIQRGDINGDGIEDIELCFTDKAKHATYHAQSPLLVTKYAPTSFVIAVKFEVNGCENYAK